VFDLSRASVHSRMIIQREARENRIAICHPLVDEITDSARQSLFPIRVRKVLNERVLGGEVFLGEHAQERHKMTPICTIVEE
jgi:hypothetical protein